MTHTEDNCTCENCIRSANAKKAIEYLMRRKKHKLAEYVYIAAQDAEKYHKLVMSFAAGEIESVRPVTISDAPDSLQ